MNTHSWESINCMTPSKLTTRSTNSINNVERVSNWKLNKIGFGDASQGYIHPTVILNNCCVIVGAGSIKLNYWTYGGYQYSLSSLIGKSVVTKSDLIASPIKFVLYESDFGHYIKCDVGYHVGSSGPTGYLAFTYKVYNLINSVGVVVYQGFVYDWVQNDMTLNKISTFTLN